jgi:hypothetical protein
MLRVWCLTVFHAVKEFKLFANKSGNLKVCQAWGNTTGFMTMVINYEEMNGSNIFLSSIDLFLNDHHNKQRHKKEKLYN